MKNRRYPNKLYPHKNYKPIAVDFSLNDYYLLRYTIDNEPANDRQNDLGKHLKQLPVTTVLSFLTGNPWRKVT